MWMAKHNRKHFWKAHHWTLSMQSRQWLNHHWTNSLLRDSWDLQIPPRMPHQITIRQRQISVLEMINNGQSALTMTRNTHTRNLTKNQQYNNVIIAAILWMLHSFYQRNQAKLVLRFSINQQCQPSKLRIQFNQESMWMEIRHQTWRLAMVVSISTHSQLQESLELTIPMELVVQLIQISNRISRCLLHKWAWKDKTYSALPVKSKHSDHLRAWKAAMDQSKLEASSLASFNLVLNHHHRSMMKIKRKANRIKIPWRILNQWNSFAQI